MKIILCIKIGKKCLEQDGIEGGAEDGTIHHALSLPSLDIWKV